MRWLGVLLSTAACVASIDSSAVVAQGEDARSEVRVAPYATHQDARHGHNHVYPDRGAIFREVPHGSIIVNHAGISYRFHDGVWFEPQGPAFLVVAPPIGLIVPTLPAFATTLGSGAETYLYANSIYYRPRSDLGGYEVVNDPESLTRTPATADTSATAQPSDETPPTVTPAPPALASASPVPPVPSPVAAEVPTAAAAPPIPVPTDAPSPVAPATPAVPVSTPSAAAPIAHGLKVSADPKNGQSLEQQAREARDHYECYRFAALQSGFDPMRPTGSAASGEQQSNYDRAQAACFEGRGYALR